MSRIGKIQEVWSKTVHRLLKDGNSLVLRANIRKVIIILLLILALLE